MMNKAFYENYDAVCEMLKKENFDFGEIAKNTGLTWKEISIISSAENDIINVGIDNRCFNLIKDKIEYRVIDAYDEEVELYVKETEFAKALNEIGEKWEIGWWKHC